VPTLVGMSNPPLDCAVGGVLKAIGTTAKDGGATGAGTACGMFQLEKVGGCAWIGGLDKDRGISGSMLML